MTKIPLTRVPAAPEKAAAVRSAVRNIAFARNLPRRLAEPSDTPAFFDLIADPLVSGPIYTLPKPPTIEAARGFIERHMAEQARGEGLLLFDIGDREEIAAYHDVQIWPEWSAGEISGAIRPDKQGAGAGALGAAATFQWMFDRIGVDLICETAALDNIRTRKLLERLGFRFIGQIESELPGGGVRPSLYWEMTREEWARRNG